MRRLTSRLLMSGSGLLACLGMSQSLCGGEMYHRGEPMAMPQSASREPVVQTTTPAPGSGSTRHRIITPTLSSASDRPRSSRVVSRPTQARRTSQPSPAVASRQDLEYLLQLRRLDDAIRIARAHVGSYRDRTGRFADRNAYEAPSAGIVRETSIRLRSPSLPPQNALQPVQHFNPTSTFAHYQQRLDQGLAQWQADLAALEAQRARLIAEPQVATGPEEQDADAELGGYQRRVEELAALQGAAEQKDQLIRYRLRRRGEFRQQLYTTKFGLQTSAGVTPSHSLMFQDLDERLQLEALQSEVAVDQLAYERELIEQYLQRPAR